MTAFFPDLALTLSQRRWSCVLDPALALCEYGLPLVKRLGAIMDLWVVREFWHILDNTYLDWQPALRTGNSEDTTSIPLRRARQTLSILKEWERLRMETDLGSLNLFWLGDGIGESLLPKETDVRIVRRWEWLAQTLEQQIPHPQEPGLAWAFRDVAALTAALGSAFVLTCRSSADVAQNLPPAICTAWEGWGISCQPVDAQDAIAAREGDYLRQLLIQAGLAKFLWMGLHLAVLHLVVPHAAAIGTAGDWGEEFSLSDWETWSELGEKGQVWQEAQGFWYSI